MDSDWADATPHYEMRPTHGFHRLPYETMSAGASESMAAGAVEPALVALGPHYSPIGVTVYSPAASASGALQAVAGQVLVASHGSWNRDPWIGYRVDAFQIDLSSPAPTYAVTNHSILVPPLREIFGSSRIRPVDVATSPADGALLMTADRDDFMGGDRGGGLYRIATTSSATGTSIPLPNAGDAILGGTASLERLVALPCARQLVLSRVDPSLVFISSFQGFCPANAAGAIYVVQLDMASGGVVRSATLASGLNEPQGIDAGPLDGALYVATAGNSDAAATRGNCVLRLRDVDALALGVLDGTMPALQSDDARLEAVSCGFTRVQQQHYWRSLRVSPSGAHAIVSVGADCNWPCSSSSDEGDYQTTLVAINLTSGTAAVAATGIRNAIGMHFTAAGDLLFTAFGSDNGDGIPNGGNGQNVPECELNVLRLRDGF